MAAAPAPKLPLPTSQLSQGYNKQASFLRWIQSTEGIAESVSKSHKVPYSRRQERNPTTNSQQIRTNSSV
ncbi:hypothetical protein FOQG_15195 [Fusarium oxysporum f. sp. raphani 54005]|uniref:Uncharacterized protein n=1 Tax=Fusarium oxysporum f. sp. raphani 54005 TaxID=1089458 RepID=X0BMY4_FUSOX|nr:hypothetical protein FOQG_15195 [Fusarium oxysporum f. sp. raphani 54005]